MLLFGWQVDGMTLQVVLPSWFFFYTFQGMSYAIDIYRKEIEPIYTRELAFSGLRKLICSSLMWEYSSLLMAEFFL